MYLACFICILSMFDEKNPPKTWLICDILTGTTQSALGHLLHAVFWNKTNLVEKNICSVLHTRCLLCRLGGMAELLATLSSVLFNWSTQ